MALNIDRIRLKIIIYNSNIKNSDVTIVKKVNGRDNMLPNVTYDNNLTIEQNIYKLVRSMYLDNNLTNDMFYEFIKNFNINNKSIYSDQFNDKTKKYDRRYTFKFSTEDKNYDKIYDILSKINLDVYDIVNC